MRAHRLALMGGLLLAVCTFPLLRPTAAGARGPTCITTVAGDTCLATCIGTQQRACGSDSACHRGIAAVLQSIARTPADSSDCADLVAMIEQVCGCAASPSGAFLE